MIDKIHGKYMIRCSSGNVTDAKVFTPKGEELRHVRHVSVSLTPGKLIKMYMEVCMPQIDLDVPEAEIELSLSSEAVDWFHMLAPKLQKDLIVALQQLHWEENGG